MGNSTRKKTLVITGLNDKLNELFPMITNKKAEELIIIKTMGNSISQPYDSIMRSIIIAVYQENIEEIYIIGEKDSTECSINKDEFLSKIQKANVSSKEIKAIEYFGVVGEDLMSWLVGREDIKTILKENISLIKNHPLIPKNVKVYGFIASAELSEFEEVS
ncbi:carbonic anhydrase [Lysinibacillus sp. PLM2]|nr:carbonic anhydrase [Lysinibacillus sp. PLM2]